MAAPIAAVASSASAAQATTTTNLTMNAASEAVIDLPGAQQEKFTTMVLAVDGRANWGAGAYGYWTKYVDGSHKTGAPMTSSVLYAGRPNWTLLDTLTPP
jgi:hypothetical protein